MERTIKEVVDKIKGAHPQDQHQPLDTAKSEDVTLTEDEVKRALAAALTQKRAKLNEIAYWQKVSQPKIYPKMNYKEMYAFALSRGRAMVPDFVVDESNEEIFTNLCWYFSSNGQEEPGELDPNKGIILLGPVGCGKTVLMRCFTANPVNSFVEISAPDIALQYSKKEEQGGGPLSIERFSNLHSVIDPSLFFGQKEVGLFIDDFGTENNAKHYGTELNVLEQILLRRYNNPNLRAKTHMTSNLSADEIELFYGTRVRSRIREMFNWVTFDIVSPDRRK